jgi:hypothetical protein
MVEVLSAIDPIFGNWHIARGEVAPLAALSRGELINFIAQGVATADDGSLTPQNGYYFEATTWLKRTSNGLRIPVHAGNYAAGKYLTNTAIVQTEPLNSENTSFINVAVMKRTMLALAATWGATWCSVYPWNLLNLMTKPEPHRPWFSLAWMTYISPRFAPMITPPRTAICERVPGGGLLMIATEERFSADNPAHLAVARDIEAALAPVNALPWPPDAEPQST